MEIKLIEIRDRATFIPAVAIKLYARTEEELWLLRRAGYLESQVLSDAIQPYILLTRLDGGRCEYDPYNWDNRSWRWTHLHLLEKWDEIESGDVVDVEFILGETRQPKVSERLTVK
jgi:hypothetical protein